MTEEQRAILQALQDLGGKDLASMDIAKKLGFDKKFPKAPRAPVRNAMESLHELHFVTSKKAGIKFSFSITEKGMVALKTKHVAAVKDKKAGSADNPASNNAPSERTANTDIQCPTSNVWDQINAVHCKECGTQLK